MNISYKTDKDIKLNQLMDLYSDVQWVGYTDHPEKLGKIIENSLFNISAWNDDELVGLIRVVGDDASIIYIQDILVKEAYQHQGIGSYLLQQILERYSHIRQIVLMTDNTEKTKSYYMKNGMVDTADYDGVCFIKYNFKA